jgi:hypothetical protein
MGYGNIPNSSGTEEAGHKFGLIPLTREVRKPVAIVVELNPIHH